ncbi:phage tail sheath family protein [Streptomyces sp. NPDC092307]|uniref:phage tail sheath family protein n=1 Tax=Streptomyces sp. NPDC092307 TaxID=3366013 RepID=UPI00380CBF2F
MATYLSPGVFVEESTGGSRPVEGVGTAVAAFVGLAEQGPMNEPVRITNWGQFTKTFGEFLDGTYLGHSVYGYFANGGGTCYVVRVGTGTDSEDAEDAGDAGVLTVLSPASDALLGGFKVTAPHHAGREVSVTVRRTAVDPKTRRASSPVTASADKAKAGKDAEGVPPGPEGEADSYTFNITVDGALRESFEVSAGKNTTSSVIAQVKERSAFVVLEQAVPGSAPALPDQATVTLAVATTSAPVTAARGAVARYLGQVGDRSGLAGLEAVDDVTIVVAPDLMADYERGVLSREQVKAIQLAMIDHCECMANRMAILDPLPGMGPTEVHAWRQHEAGFDSKYAALYYPWIQVSDPSTGKSRLLPPSGHVAGLWARNDEARGVHKAPANEVLRGALDLAIQVTKGEQEQLNPAGVNCIRSFPGRGIRVWGARTLSSDPAWRYLNVRRLFNYLEESVYLGSQWVVFEPNNERLWATIRRNIAAFLTNEWRNGALFGSTPDEAFYVKCDAETNPPEVIDSGQVVCEIGVAPVKPAEFVVFRISQESLSGPGSAE